jgi:hypothetical protein
VRWVLAIGRPLRPPLVHVSTTQIPRRPGCRQNHPLITKFPELAGTAPRQAPLRRITMRSLVILSIPCSSKLVNVRSSPVNPSSWIDADVSQSPIWLPLLGQYIVVSISLFLTIQTFYSFRLTFEALPTSPLITFSSNTKVELYPNLHP